MRSPPPISVLPILVLFACCYLTCRADDDAPYSEGRSRSLRRLLSVESEPADLTLETNETDLDDASGAPAERGELDGAAKECDTDNPLTAAAAVVEEGTAELASEKPIAPYDEWALEKLKEQQKDAQQAAAAPCEGAAAAAASNGNGRAAVDTQRNYASKECGAKVLLTNAEAEHVNAVLNEKEHDEYMRNPCAMEATKFVVVELCETIQPTQVDVANFELFSSSLERFRLFGARRYPTNEWAPLGEWTAADNRKAQSFAIAQREYAKFIKIELLTHYGSEHYCTLSLIRAFGISMVDEYEEAADQDLKSQPPVPADSAAVPVTTTAEEPAKVEADAAAKQRQPNLVERVVNITKDVLDRASLVFFPGRRKKEPTLTFSARHKMCYQCAAARKFKSYAFCRLFGLANGSTKKAAVLETQIPPPPTERADSTLSPVPTAESVAEMPAETVPTPEPTPAVFGTPPAAPLRKRRRRRADGQRQFLELVRFVMDSSRLERTAAATPKPVESRPPAATSNQTAPAASHVIVPGSTTSQKESVFIRLNNRIRALELNISLSGQYLSEMSRKYVKQMEELQRQYNRTWRVFNETSERVAERLNEQADDLKRLGALVERLVVGANLSHFGVCVTSRSLARWPSTHQQRETEAVRQMRGLVVLLSGLVSALVLVVAVLLCCRCRGTTKAQMRAMVQEELQLQLALAQERAPLLAGALSSGADAEGLRDGDAQAQLTAAVRRRRRQRARQPSAAAVNEALDTVSTGHDSALESAGPTASEQSSEMDFGAPPPSTPTQTDDEATGAPDNADSHAAATQNRFSCLASP